MYCYLIVVYHLKNVLGQVGGMYRKYNALINAFRLWIYRTPQLKMLRGNREIVQLRVNRNLSHSFDTDSIQNSSSIVGRNISLNSKGLTDKSCMNALRKWNWFSGRSRFLRIAASAVKTLSEKNVVTRVCKLGILCRSLQIHVLNPKIVLSPSALGAG